jgi:hypothetical protein
MVYHLRRDATIKHGAEPELYHLKDSGSIEETGTHIILLWSSPKESPGELAGPKAINWKMAKSRDGLGGSGDSGKLFLNRNTLEITE